MQICLSNLSVEHYIDPTALPGGNAVSHPSPRPAQYKTVENSRIVDLRHYSTMQCSLEQRLTSYS